MSTDLKPDYKTIIELNQGFRYAVTGTYFLAVYDYLLLMDREYRHVSSNIWLNLEAYLTGKIIRFITQGAKIWSCVVNIQNLRFYTGVPGSGCYENRSRNAGGQLSTFIVSGMILDAIALFVIVAHCCRTRSIYGKLGQLFLYQCLGFYSLLLLVYGLALVAILKFLTFLHKLRPIYETASMSYAILVMLPNILACRFIIQLREHATPSESKQLRVVSKQLRRAIVLGDNRGPNHVNEDIPLRAMETDRVW
ncbi:hypothetical protein JR316_0012341 [Psilocybe cubensis]|uniref:Uncharacterized protein n=1 Tax=Psilocybe cubensis TaxID=181762 RepID=A0ACB8GIE8_PSICU|nr:hypothetical protein JR316_0012341 [Psilocybe cubensis]KAH9475230.1 hypothetical protein JR316_0012341 [Psilocybe cubensis]